MRNALILGALLLAGCYAPVQEPSASSNGEVDVGLLTTFEDCRVYRLIDAGRPVYIARCGDGAKAAWHEQTVCGKGCIRNELRQSETVDPLAPTPSKEP